MKRILMLAAAVAACVSFADSAAGTPGIPLATIVNLNGPWSFVAGDTPAREVQVPHTWNVEAGLQNYRGKATYVRNLGDVSAEKGKTARVYFTAVYHTAKVSVNGNPVGEHVGGYTPFSCDITSALDFGVGAKNELKVEVDNAPCENNFPFMMKYDWAGDGGIYRGVELRFSDGPGIRYVHVTPNLATGEVKVETKLWDGQIIRDSFKVENPIPWHFDRPHLYSYTAKAGGEERTVRYGFRDLHLEGESLVFNGEKVRLPGLETMPGSNPKYGMAEPLGYQRKVMEMMRNANTILTRFHWVQDDAVLDACDELGLLVQEELSWWGEPGTLTPAQYELAEKLMTELIEAHYNHPSIVMWCLSNEIHGNTEQLKTLAKSVKSLDPTRLVNSVCNDTQNEFEKSSCYSLDLPSWNDYTGTWFASGRREILPGLLDRMHERAPGRALLISEAGLCEPAHSGGDARRVDDMIYHLREWQKRPFVCGYIYFCLNDYRTDIGEEGVDENRIRRHGLVDKVLNPKPSFGTFAGLASPIEITAVKTLSPDNRQVRFTVTNRDTIPRYTVKGYYAQYRSASGELKRVDLPTLKPGESHSFELADINGEYALEIVRPTGHVCTRY